MCGREGRGGIEVRDKISKVIFDFVIRMRGRFNQLLMVVMV